VGNLVRTGRPQEEGNLASRLADVEAALTERAAEVHRARIDVATFRIRYRKEVGLLHEELEELERAIAELELGEIAKRFDEDSEPADSSAGPPPESAPRLTSDAVRRLFRDVAKTIHPDLAEDDHSRDRRHALMIEANRAYAVGDEERLRRILEAWENSPESVQGDDPQAAQLRLARRISQLEEQLAVYTRELEELKESPLWQLKAMVDEAAARGKDLVADMVRRLKRDIVAARNRLDAMRWHP
jgi:hypothetical protein